MSTQAKTTRGIKSKTTGGTVAGSCFCYVCQKTIPTKSAKSSHKRDNHDGRLLRIFPLKCQWCDIKPMSTRPGLAGHLTHCQGVLRLQFPLPCPFCNTECQGPTSLSKHSSDCYMWEQDTTSDDQLLDEFDKELIRATRHPATARHTGQWFEKAELRLENGERELAFILSRGCKRPMKDTKALVHFPKRRAPEVVEDTKLDAALESHSYGRLVCLEDYRLLENNDSIWKLPFLGNGDLLATMFEGMMIQSGDDILNAYKVEVYGTAEYEDPHAQELAKPEGKNAFKVENVYHDQTHKVMVGALQWCVLVTLAVMLTDGTVIVGPDNKFFHPKSSSQVWIKKTSYDCIKKEPAEAQYNTMARQLRSKFNNKATFAHYSAINPLLNHHETMPVTLRTLYGFKIKKAWSGVKVAAFVFNQLYTEHKIVKAEVQTHIEEALSIRNGKSCESLKILENMVQVMAEEEALPVSKPVNRCLTELAGRLSGEITNLNNTDVMEAVVKKIKSMI